jgi:hypothetical protein
MRNIAKRMQSLCQEITAVIVSFRHLEHVACYHTFVREHTRGHSIINALDINAYYEQQKFYYYI